MRSVTTTLLILICAITAFADDPALITGRITVFGSKIEVSPSLLETPAGIPIFLNTTGKGLSGKLRGELRGPGINGAVTFETDPGSPFQLPALQTKGVYYFEDIRLENNGQILASATPDRVEIHVIDVLISKITSRPLSLEEIQSLGIVINESDFTAVSFEVGLEFSSKQVTIGFPILIPKQANLQPLIPNVPTNVTFATPQLVGGPDSHLIGEIPSFVPVTFSPNRPDFDGILPDIPGILIFPNDIAFLNQFFAVVLMVRNGASPGTSLTVDKLTAQMSFDPDEMKLVKTNPSVTLGSPVPVRLPGLDQVIGTADDLDLIVAGATAQTEFFAEGLQEGTHTVRMNLNGTLRGLVQGDVPITGTATGAVLVRNPNFSITFSHPSIVRAFEEYDLFVTVTNTSTVDANLVRLSLPTNELVNCVVVSPPYFDFDRIRSGESATATFRINPQVTGQVTTAVITSSDNVKGQFKLRVAVGEKGIPLSPNTLLLPEFANQLGAELLQKGLSVLGLAYSAATAPPGSLPPGVPYMSKSIVTQRAIEFAQAGQRLQLGEALSSVLSNLLLDWLGNDVFDAGFADLLTTTESGNEFLNEVFGQLHIGSGNAMEFHDYFADSTFFRNRYLSVMLTSSSSPAGLSITDANGNLVGDRFATADGLMQWDLIGNFANPPSHALRITGTGGTSDLSILVPIGSSFYKAQLNNLSTASGKSYEIVFDNTLSATELKLKDEQGTISSIPLTAISGASPAVITAVQDAKADKTGHIIAVLFNQPVTEDSAENLANYSVAGNRVIDVRLQLGGRIAYISFQNAISPFVDTDLLVSGVQSASTLQLVQGSTRIKTTVTNEAGKVIGRFFASDGRPIPNARVTLTEIDHDDIFGERVAHITAQAYTNAQGEYSFDYVRKLQEPFTISAQDPLTGEMGSSSSTVTYTNQLIRLDIVLLGRGTIKGRVFQRSGTNTIPVAGAVVTALATNEPNARSVLTDANGNYLVDRVAVGPVNLSAQNQNLGDAYKFFGATSTAIQLAGSVVTADIEVTTTAPGTVNGRVLESNGTDPIVGAYVILAVAGAPTLAVHSDNQGAFQFDQVPPGLVTVTVTDTATGRTIGFASVNLISGTVTINIVASGSGSIEAIVSLASGMSLGDVVVAVEGTPYSQRLTVNNSVLFNSIPVGNWSVFANNTKTGDIVYSSAKVLYAGSTAVVTLRFSEKGTIGGQIKTVDQQPAPGSTVLLFTGQFFEFLTDVTTADSNGQYIFKDVQFGKYAVHAIAPNQNDGGSSPVVSLTTSQRNGVADVTFLGKGTITVTVTTDAGPVITPVRLSTVTFGFDGRIGREITFTKTTGANGVAVFSNIFRTGFMAEASTILTAPGRVSGTLTGPTANVLIELDENPNISGHVHDADGNNIQAQVTYTGASGTQTLTTAPDGSFTFNRIAVGQATFTASAGSTKGVEERTIEFSNPDLHIHLLGFGSVHGMIKDAAGNPVAGATLKLEVHGILARTLQGVSAPDGTYGFNSVPEGPITIEATDGTTGGRGGTTIIHKGDVSLDVILGATGTVQGTVFQSDNVTRVVAAEVTLKRGGADIGIATTDGNGNYLFRYVPISRNDNDTYQLGAFSKSTGRRASSNTFVITSNNEIVNKNLILEGLGSLRGFVFDYTGVTPVPGALLDLKSYGVVITDLTATSGAAGDYIFGAVPQGSYDLVAKDDLLVGKVTGSITQDGEQKNQNVTLQPGAQISGVIQFFDGTQIPQGTSAVVQVNGAANLFVDAPDGNFHIDALP
ncbi:carboxypeptidase-like regulatory domain-containing protein, partial [bacterium]|nr:carboxypeptidase-like regulatory domain-containing protein [bacterium]